MKRTLAVLVITLALSLPCRAQIAPSGGESPPADETKQTAASESETLVLMVPLASPLFSKVPIALVNDEPITVENLKEAIGSIHGEMKENRTSGRRHYGELIDRLITTQLIVDEARATGMAELPEVKKAVDGFARDTLLELLQSEHTKDVKPDEDQVEKLYREMVKSYRISSILVDKEEDAKSLAEGIRAGKTFEEVTEAARQGDKLKADERGALVKPKDLLPQIREAVSKMAAGTMSPVVTVGSAKDPDYAIIKLEGIEFPENKKAMQEAREQVLNRKKIEALVKYNTELYKKYLKMNKKLLDSLDFEARKPGFQNLLQDKRVIAQVKGDKPVTVADLADALRKKFFHGMEEAIQGKKVNKKKDEALQEILTRKVLRLEALKLGIDKTEKYKKLVSDHERSVLFGVFLQKAVAPGIKMSEEDLKKYYDDHKTEFTYPQMMKLQSLAFSKIVDAQSALDKLMKGAEFSWVKANAEGQVVKSPKPILQFTGEAVITNELDEGVRKGLTGAQTGDARLYESPGGIFYVLYVQEVIPENQQPFGEVREGIAKRVFNQKVGEAIEEWGRKLRKASDVRVYATDRAPEKTTP